MACVVNPDGTISCPDGTSAEFTAMASYIARAGKSTGAQNPNKQSATVDAKIKGSSTRQVVIILDEAELGAA